MKKLYLLLLILSPFKIVSEPKKPISDQTLKRMPQRHGIEFTHAGKAITYEEARKARAQAFTPLKKQTKEAVENIIKNLVEELTIVNESIKKAAEEERRRQATKENLAVQEARDDEIAARSLLQFCNTK